MDALRVLRDIGEPVATRAQLLAGGATPRGLTAAVRADRLIRVREGYYAVPGTDPFLLQAVRIGGRLGCVSALQARRVWVAPHLFPHVALDPKASRLRSPRDRFRRLRPETLDGCELHWRASVETGQQSVHTTGIVDALLQAVRCQPKELAVASLDSALHQRLTTPGQGRCCLRGATRAVRGTGRTGRRAVYVGNRDDHPLDPDRARDTVRTTGGLPRYRDGGLRRRGVRGRGDRRSPRTRWCRRVASLRDYARDAALAARGYIVVRLNYRQVMFERDIAVAAILGALRSHRRGPAV
jgi:hypothetical protein